MNRLRRIIPFYFPVWLLFSASVSAELTVIADLGGRDATPFQGMVSDRLNRAGWYLIVAPIVGLVNFIVCFLAGTGGNWGLWMSGMMVMIGIILLLIARIFDYGMGLQREVDGLL